MGSVRGEEVRETFHDLLTAPLPSLEIDADDYAVASLENVVEANGVVLVGEELVGGADDLSQNAWEQAMAGQLLALRQPDLPMVASVGSVHALVDPQPIRGLSLSSQPPSEGAMPRDHYRHVSRRAWAHTPWSTASKGCRVEAGHRPASRSCPRPARGLLFRRV